MKIKNKRGITLLELVVVMSVMGILAGITIASMSPVKISARLDAELKKMGAAIQTAQSYALQGKNIPGEIICGYGFRFLANHQEYEIYYNPLDDDSFENCQEQHGDGSFSHYISGSETVESFNLEEGISLFSPAWDDAEIYFDIPNGNAHSRSGDLFRGETFTLGIADGNFQKSAVINDKAYIAF